MRYADPPGYEVSGGAGGVVADLAALTEAAQRLDDLALEVAGVASHVWTVACSSALVVSGNLDPVGVARVHRHLVPLTVGPQSLGAQVGHLTDLGVRTRVTVRAYAEAQRATTAVLQALRDRVAHSVGVGLSQWPVLAAAAAAAGVAVAAGGSAWAGYRAVPLVAREYPVLVLDVATGRFRPGDLPGRWQRVRHTHQEVLRRDAEHGGRLASHAGHEAAVWLAHHPGVAEAVVSALPPALTGMTAPVVAGPSGLGGDPDRRWWPPRDVGDLVAVVGALGANRWFVDGPVTVRRLPDPPPAVPTGGVSGAVQRLARYADDPQAPTDRVADRVRVEEVRRPSGTVWAVYVPPTQQWFGPSGSAFDGSTNVQSFGGLDNASAAAVQQAVLDAGVPVGAPVLLAGYSQGGLVATQLAADPLFSARYDVTAVLTVGSPVGERDLPDHVPVLSVEHAQDLVVALDGRSNPEHLGWTTVRRDLLETRSGPPGFADTLARDPFAAHGIEHYRGTAAVVDTSTDPSVQAWRQAAAPFLDTGDATVRAVEYDVRRAGG